MNDFDKLEKDIKLKIAISEIDDENNERINVKRIVVWQRVAVVACICLFLTTGFTFGKNIEEYLKNIFINSTESIDKAVENGYVQTEEMEYTYDKNIGVKVDSLILDDLNLDVSFCFNVKDENLKSIRFEDFEITTETGKVVYKSELEYANTVEEIPIYNSVNLWNAPEKVTDTIYKDSILLGLKLDRENFKELYFDISSIQKEYNDGKKETVYGSWNFNVIIDDKMIQNTSQKYILNSKNKYVENATAILAPSGMIINVKFSNIINIDNFSMEDLQSIYLKNGEKAYNVEYIEEDIINNIMILHYNNISNITDNGDELILDFEFLDENEIILKKS